MEILEELVPCEICIFIQKVLFLLNVHIETTGVVKMTNSKFE